MIDPSRLHSRPCCHNLFEQCISVVIGLLSNKMVCCKCIFINLAKRGYCNAGICVHICVCICMFAAMYHIITSDCYIELFDDMTYLLTSWQKNTYIYVLTYVWLYDKLFDVITYFWRFDIVTYWVYEMSCIFNIFVFTYLRTFWRYGIIVDIMTYFPYYLMMWHTFWMQYIKTK